MKMTMVVNIFFQSDRVDHICCNLKDISDSKVMANGSLAK